MKRIAVASLLQETNTFSPKKTLRKDFKFEKGENLIKASMQEKTEMQGFIKVLKSRKKNIIPILGGWAVSSGRILENEFQSIVDDLIKSLQNAFPVDGILLALHGAWVSEKFDSADGYVLERVRKVIGNEIPIVVSLDLHANISKTMQINANALMGYRTCPHIDVYETGQRAANLLVDMLDNNLCPKMAVSKIPMITQAENHMSDRGVFKKMLDYARSIEKKNEVLSVSIFPMQPWLDVKEAGWSTVVITDNNCSLAEKLSKNLAKKIWMHRNNFLVKLLPIDKALDKGMRIQGGPVTLGDGSDGTMGGAPGDSVWILSGILKKSLDNESTAVVVVDSHAVSKSIRAGVDKTVNLTIGGSLNPHYNNSIKIKGVVKFISDGSFQYKGKVYTGRLVQMGRCVVVKVNNINILIAEKTMPTTDPEMYRSQGIEPIDMKFVVVKSPLGLRTEYEPISKAIISVDSPGCCRADLKKLPFKRIPRPMFPFDNLKDEYYA